MSGRQVPLTEEELLHGYGVSPDEATAAAYPQQDTTPGWWRARRRCACGERRTELRVSPRDEERLELHCLACGRRWTRKRTGRTWQP